MLRTVLPVRYSLVVLIVLSFLAGPALPQGAKHSPTSFKGPLEPNPVVSVSCPLTTTDRAQIMKMLIKKGDYVLKGQLLAQLDDREAYLRFIQSVVGYNDQSGVETAESVVVLRDAEMRRAEYLIKTGPGAARDLELARAQREVAIASLDKEYASRIAAAMSMEYQAKQLADRLVISPLSGVVLQTQLDEGEVAQGGAPIIDIIDLDTVFVRLDMSIDLIGKVKVGDKAEVVLDIHPDKKYDGAVEYVSPIADPAANTFLVRVAVKAPVQLKGAQRVKVYEFEEVEKARAGKVRGGAVSNPALEAIVKILETQKGLKASTQLELAKALAVAGDERALSGLVGAAKSGNIEDRSAAARALGNVRSKESVELLIKILDDSNSDVRWWAENSLSKLGRLAVDALVPVIEKGSENASRSAASALAQIVLRNTMMSAIPEDFQRTLGSIATGYADPSDYILKYQEKEVAQRDYEITSGLYAKVTFPHLAE